ncbi:MAG: hypothetical protein HC905_04685 [Bacteroidales bacterium]|nr:hypothetical protein [Bacteroidales bacterium]
MGWYKNEADKKIKNNISNYLGYKSRSAVAADALIRMAYSSVGQITIVPMQDILKLDHTSRLNTPGTTHGNWNWKLEGPELNSEHTDYLKNLSLIYGR